ncbi:Cell division control protein 48 B [Orobanche minor]
MESSNDFGKWKAEEAIAGNAKALQALRKLITYPLLYSHEARKLGLKLPRGLLLYGPPGTGKTSLVEAVVRECDAHLIYLSPHNVQGSHAGEREKILRDAFAEASSHIKPGKPSVIFIDEIDAICPRRDSRRQQDLRLVSQLRMLMDSSATSASGAKVVVVASTNRVDALDPTLRRSGRFDAEIEVTTPSEEERLQILKLYTKNVLLDSTVNLEVLAALCNGYVGADLEALCREAVICAVKRSSNADGEANVCSLLMEDWKNARSRVGPSITRGFTVEIPKVSWDDIGGLNDLKKKLKQAVELPLKHSDAFSRLGISPVRGILLHGPPGCSKTTLAKAAAHAAQASFFYLRGAELFSMYVGEGEALLRNTFRRARLVAPSIIFFDEADVIAAKRGSGSSGSSTVGERLLSTLLTEMDGLEEAKANSCTLYPQIPLLDPWTSEKFLGVFVYGGYILVLSSEFSNLSGHEFRKFSICPKGHHHHFKKFSNLSKGHLTRGLFLGHLFFLPISQGILVLAATNRPDAIDAALMRPGRFDLVLYVPPPDLEARHEILRVLTRGMKVGNDVDLRQLAEETEHFTGAELEGLCREAGIVALREDITASIVHARHFQTVKRSLKPMLTKHEIDSYASYMKKPTRNRPTSAGNGKCKKTLRWASVVRYTVGVVGLIVVGACQIWFVRV